MMRMPRLFPSVVVACCAVTLPVIVPQISFAQVAPTKSPANSVDASLKGDVDSFWHYAKTFRYDMASASGQKVLEKKDQPVAVLAAFEAVAADRKENLEQMMLRWQQVPELRETVDPIAAVLADANRQRRTDQSIIEANILRLPVNEQTYLMAIGHLRDSGELAVPLMLDYLRNPTKKEYHAAIRRALVDLGRSALNPLVAATEMPSNERDQSTLLVVIAALGDIGYDVSIPPLAYLANDAKVPAVVKAAAKDALKRMGTADAASLNATNLFYEIAQKYYYGTAAIAADVRNPVAYYWQWDQEKGLTKKDVPSAIFGDLMAMRASRMVLSLDANRGDALALWLTANYGREVQLAPGTVDPTRTAQTPSAHYYGVAAGAKYLNMVLARALNDHQTGTALAAIKSLQKIGGQSNLFAPKQTESLVAAMRYPDRVVRFEAAFASAGALPQSAFEGQERVVPILAEAVAQTGKPYVLVVMPEEKLNATVQGLKDAGYNAAGATNAEAAAAVNLPAVDVIYITDDNAAEVDKLRQLASQTPRLQGAAMVIGTKSAASPFSVIAASNPLISVTQATKPQDLKAVLEAARKKAGSLPMDEKVATEYALKATELIGQLAMSRGQVLDLSAANNTLMQALQDSRTDVVKASGVALGLTNSRSAQSALLAKAADAKSDEQVKLSMYRSLTTSAKFFGNLLEAQEVKDLQKSVVEEASADVRSAAAEAHGALNLPADQVKAMLLK